MKQLAVFLIFAFILGAADKKPVPELPPSVRPVVDLARAAPPELFIATVLRLIEDGKIPQREQLLDLLEEAFAVASSAQEPIRLIAIPATPADTRALYRSKAGEILWDALSLQSRIVKNLLTIDRQKARELFDRIARPILDPRPCEDPFVTDVSTYYDLAGGMAQLGFTSQEKEKELHVQFLATVLTGARSPGELAPFARVMRSVELTPPQRQLLTSALAAKLQSIGPDYRAFALSYPELEAALASDPQIAAALSDYKKAQLTAARCQPDFGPSTDQVQPVSRGAAFKADPYFQDEASKQIGASLTRLRTLTNSPDWNNQLADFLRDFLAWTPPGAAMDVFHQKATVFRALFEFVPRGDDRDRILNLAVAFLQSDAEREAPAEWFYQVKMMMDAARQDAPAMLQAFRASGSVGLALYADLEPAR